MHVASNFLALVFVVSPIVAVTTPSAEFVILIKATTTSVSDDFFSFEILPFIERLILSPFAWHIPPPAFPRISVLVGGNSDWPEGLLKTQSQSEFGDSLYKLRLPYGRTIQSVGNEFALQAALQTFYHSSAAINRMVILFTDEVLMSDAESEYAKRLSIITGTNIVIIGIPSFQNPSFNASMLAAIRLARHSHGVYSSIESASNQYQGMNTVVNTFMWNAKRICQRTLMLYENSKYVDLAFQKNFITMINSSRALSNYSDAIAVTSFDDFLNDEIVFLPPKEVSKWNATPSDSFELDHGSKGSDVYEKLVKIYQSSDFPYLNVVILTQADVFTKGTRYSMSNLGKLNHDNNIFVFDASKSISNQIFFQPLLPYWDKSVVNVQEEKRNLSMAATYDGMCVLCYQRCESHDAVPMPTTDYYRKSGPYFTRKQETSRSWRVYSNASRRSTTDNWIDHTTAKATTAYPRRFSYASEPTPTSTNATLITLLSINLAVSLLILLLLIVRLTRPRLNLYCLCGEGNDAISYVKL